MILSRISRRSPHIRSGSAGRFNLPWRISLLGEDPKVLRIVDVEIRGAAAREAVGNERGLKVIEHVAELGVEFDAHAFAERQSRNLLRPACRDSNTANCAERQRRWWSFETENQASELAINCIRIGEDIQSGTAFRGIAGEATAVLLTTFSWSELPPV